VRHVGDPVALIVAETAAQAQDALEAVMVEYDILPAITDLATATNPGQPLVWPNAAGNVCFDWQTGDQAATDAAFASAAHVTRITVVNNRVITASMEARVALAEFADGRWTLTTNTQGGWFIKNIMARAVFHTDPQDFRVITPDVGGGFGMKLFLYPEHVLTCFAARRLGRPVKWVSSRGEAFLSDTHGRDNLTHAELAMDKAGTFLAMRTTNYAGMGAYLSNFAPMIPTLAGTKVLASVYGFRAIHARVIGVFTNTVPVDAYRGAGRPESNYLVERLIDAAAREIGMDRAEIRKRNMVGPAAMPYRTAMGQDYDSGDFVRVLDDALARIDWAGFPARRAAALAAGRRRGIGLAYYLEATAGAGTERAEIRFAADGFVDVYVGTQSTGQGHETAYVMVTADRLGVPGEKVRIHQGDTDIIPVGGGTGGARSLLSEGTALVVTAATVIERGRQAAADALEVAPADIEFAAGAFRVTGTDRTIDIMDVAARQRVRVAAGEDVPLLDAAEVATIEAGTYPNGCHIAELEVDPETGHVWTVRYLVVDDMGTVVNPMIVRGQAQGGVAQGIGQALLERTQYDAESGQLLTASFMDYALPRAEDLPDIQIELIEVPCTTNPLGVKGAGEAGAVGSPPAVMNALIDALAPDGVTAIDMPATPERVWRAIQTARAA
jgi:carbon-monoxide dehydrogenase large subunit